MTYGQDEAAIIRQCQQNRCPVPSQIQNAPVLKPEFDLFFQAFSSLSSCRQLGMSAGPIPWTAIAEYARHYGITGEQQQVLFHVIQKMDSAYLKEVNKDNGA